jgi:alpha-L-glutamate ligase-like protein
MFGLSRRLADLGIMGINRRNAEFTLAHNPRCYYPLVDDKLRTKELAVAAGIPVPEPYGVVQTEYQVRHLPVWLKDHQDFVIKPAHGSGGEGILVIAERARTNFRTVSGVLMTQEEVNHHVFNILGGLYSLGGQTDAALIEYRVRFDPVFEPICYQGVPDIRVIVFLGVPVMAMLRLPTRESGGKANLHQGAIGAGIDLAHGVTLKGVNRQAIVSEHPDTGHSIQGLTIPHWQTLLTIAARAYELTGLGYLGVDMVLDQDLGPLLLELNARPGLAIQIANAAGLIHRVKLVEQHLQALSSVPDRIAFARRHFGAKPGPGFLKADSGVMPG